MRTANHIFHEVSLTEWMVLCDRASPVSIAVNPPLARELLATGRYRRGSLDCPMQRHATHFVSDGSRLDLFKTLSGWRLLFMPATVAQSDEWTDWTLSERAWNPQAHLRRCGPGLYSSSGLHS